MRNTSIISTLSNGIARFENAGAEMVRALLPQEPRFSSDQPSRLCNADTQTDYLPSGHFGTAFQSWFQSVSVKPGIALGNSGTLSVQMTPVDWGTDRTGRVGLGLS